MADSSAPDRPLPDPPPPPDERRPWTVLFIGDHGRVIPFTRVKTLLGFGAAAFAVSLAAVAVLAVVNHSLHRRAVELQQSLTAAGRTISELRHERDLLTAQVVLVENRMQEMSAGFSPGRAAENRSAAEAAPAAPGAEMVLTADADRAPPAVQPPAGAGEGVTIEGFQLRGQAEKKRLDLTYRLVNASPGQKPQAGSVVVVLKALELPPEEWLTIPDVALVRGRPANPQKGYAFSIRHSKLFEHSVAFPKDIRAYTHAVVYVFSKRGELLTAREYPVLPNRGSP